MATCFGHHRPLLSLTLKGIRLTIQSVSLTMSLSMDVIVGLAGGCRLAVW